MGRGQRLRVQQPLRGAGTEIPLDVSIPRSNPTNGPFKAGTPTGTISNQSLTDFLLAPGKPAAFLFATIDGTISGWNPTVGVATGANPPALHSVIMVKTTDGSVFTGLTSATINGKRYLYAANFSKGRVDVWDNAFHKVTLPAIQESTGRQRDNDLGKPFTDARLPANYVPFNVQAIGNDIVVTYALHEDGNPIETDGPGLGRVDIYSSKWSAVAEPGKRPVAQCAVGRGSCSVGFWRVQPQFADRSVCRRRILSEQRDDCSVRPRERGSFLGR